MKSERVLENLKIAATSGRLHHAYLLSGPESPQKKEVVAQLMADIFSSDYNTAFRKINASYHPDFVQVNADNGTISVDAVRDLPKQLSYAPLEAKKRVVFIEQADAMNAQAANAILKILEEPPTHTMFFLTCRDPSQLLTTIRSRCQNIVFSPQGNDQLKSVLSEGEASASHIEMAIKISGGSLEKARACLALEESFFTKAVEHLFLLWKNSPRIPSAVVKWAEDLEQNESMELIVDIWELMLRDLAWTVSKKGSDLTFPFYASDYDVVFKQMPFLTPNQVAQKKQELNRFRVYRNVNGNARLDFFALMTHLSFSSGKRTKAE